MTDVTQQRTAMGTMLSAAILVAALFAMLAFAPFASAAVDPVGSGETKLYPKKGFVKKLNNLNVTLQKWGSGSYNGQRIALDANGGMVDPLDGKGKVTHGSSEGFRFKYGKRTVPVSELEVNTRKNWVRAKIAGANMQLGWLTKNSSGRDGFGAFLKTNQLKLTGKAARRISNKLGMKGAINGGRVITNAYTTEQPSEATILAGDNTSLALSGAAVKKLATVGPEVPPATLLGLSPEKTPIAGFPISGGALSPSANGGTLQHLGGLKLTQNLEAVEANGAGETTVEMNNIWLDLSTNKATVEVSITNPKSPAINQGSIGRVSIADVILTGATLSSDPTTRKIGIANGSASLEELTAATLNEVFFGPLKLPGTFAKGDPLGTFSFMAQAQ